jgi:hypothetical protein
MPVTLAKQGAEVGGSWSEIDPRLKSTRPYLKNKEKQKAWQYGSNVRVLA